MLVLSRKRDEALWIGRDVRITVLKTERQGVRLGIEAPSGITILREELFLDADDRAGRSAWEQNDQAPTSGSESESESESIAAPSR